MEGRPEDVFVKLLPRGSTIITQKVTLAMSPTIKLFLAMTLTPTLTQKGGHAGGAGRRFVGKECGLQLTDCLGSNDVRPARHESRLG